MSLEERSIATLRANLLTGNARFMQLVWDKTTSMVKGGNDQIVFETSIRRDVVAYALVHALAMHKAFVFGGFVRSHYSGKVWNDIDVRIGAKDATFATPDAFDDYVDSLWRTIVRFVLFLLPIAAREVHSGQTRKQYARTRTLSFGRADDRISIDVDFVQPGITRRPCLFLPPTIGSCLMLKDGMPCFRDVLASAVGHWSLHDIVAMLRAGEDVKLCMRRHRAIYREFFWSRIVRMERDGWTLHPPASNDEPKPLSTEELKRSGL